MSGGMTHIGKYKLEAEIGRGGFGLVYKAYDPEVGRPVAIKVLTGEENKDLLARFKREANAAGKLKHKNILTIYGYGEHENSPYLVMEYLEGENLETLLASGREFTLREKTSIMTQVAEGLQHAHHNGVVHRDIKPANIRILPDGSVKIMDFGIARVVGEHSARLTRQGDFIGTLAYMAPEVFHEGDVDELCDIFSYGVVFYQLVTGKNPFASDGPARVIYNLTTVQPPFASTLVPECPPALDQLIARTIHKERELRYQSFEDVLFDLMPISSQLQSAEVQTLLMQVQEWIDAHRLEDAKALLRQILQLDPGNASARKLREQINSEIQRQANSKKCEELLSSGEKYMESFDYEKAVDAFETILRLDSSHARAQSLLQEAQAAIKKRERTQTLMAQAERDANAGRLSEAYRSMLECVQYAPQDPKANALLERIRTAIRDRERQRHLDEGLSKAREFLSSSRPEDAESLLSELNASFAGLPQVEQLASEIKSALEQKRQRQRIEEGITLAEQALSAEGWSDAVGILDPLVREFPLASDLQNVMSRAKAGLDAQRKAERISQIVRDVESANLVSNYDRSIETLEKGLVTYPDDAELGILLEQTRSLKSEAERQMGVRLAIDRANRLCAENKYSAALDEIDLAAGLWGSDELRAFRKEIEAQSREYQKQQQISSACEAVGSLIEKGLYQEAIQEGRKALSRFPGHSELVTLVERAQAAVADEERLKQIDQQRKERIADIDRKARSLLERKDVRAARKLLEDTVHEFGEHPQLDQLGVVIDSFQREQERQLVVQETVSQARSMMKSANYTQAIALLESALAQYPGEETMDGLLRDAREGYKLQNKSKRIDEIISQCRRQMSERNQQAALKIARAGLEEYPDEPQLTSIFAEIKSAVAEIEKDRAILAALDSVSALEEQKEYEKAIQMLTLALEKGPSQPSLLDRLGSLKQKAARQRQINSAVDRVCELMARGMFDEALENAESAMKSFPDEIAFSTLRTDIDKSRRTEAAAKACRAIERLIASGQLDEAADRVDDALAEFAGDPAVEALRLRIEDELERRELNRRLEALLADVRRLIDQKPEEAATKIREALVTYPDSGDLKNLLARASQSITNRQRDADLRSLTGRARTLLDEGNAREATVLLEDGIRRFPDAASLVELLQRATREVSAGEEREREEKLTRTLALAQSEEQAGRPLPAIRTLQDALRDFPGNAAILSELQRIQAAYPEVIKKRTSGLKVAVIAAVLLLGIGGAGVAYRLMNSGRRDIPPPPPPPAKLARIAAFTISPDSIAPGGKAQLCYEVQDAVTVNIVPAVAGAKETDSKTCFEVAPADTTEYRLTAKNADGVEASDSRTIVVKTPVEEMGTLVVEAGQADVDIRIGNRPPERSGSNGIVEIRLKPGPYSVVAEKDGFQSEKDNVQVVLGNKAARLRFDLRKEAPISLSEGTAAGNLISSPKPVYPTARGARGAATVTLQVIINKEGAVKEATRISGNQPFVDAAIDAVKQSHYKPYVANGKPLEVSTTVSVAFTPDNPPPTTDCRRTLDSLKAANNQSGLENFIRSNDCGRAPFSAEAQTYLDKIRTDEAERKAAADKAAADKAAADKAAADKAAADKAVADKAAADKAAADKAAADKAAQRSKDLQAIANVVNNYANAMMNKSFERLKAVYPQADQNLYQRSFNAYDRYDFSIPAAGPTFTSDYEARVTCQAVLQKSRVPSLTQRLTITLNRDRSSGSWTISSIQVQ